MSAKYDRALLAHQIDLAFDTARRVLDAEPDGTLLRNYLRSCMPIIATLRAVVGRAEELAELEATE